MNKLLKYSLFGLGGLVLLLVIVAAVVAATFNPNDYKPLIVKLVQEKKQRTLHIDGDIKLAFWPKIGANLGKVSLSEHNSEQQFAAVNGLKVSLALLPLLKKQLVVDTVYVDGASANVIRHKDGSFNFDDLLSKDKEESQQIKFDIDGVNITDSAVSFSDEQAGANYSIKQFNLKTGHVALAQPFDIDTRFAVSASKPAVSATVQLSGNIMADPEHKHFVVKGLDSSIKGRLMDVSDADIKISGDVDAKPETAEFLVNGLKLVASGVQKGTKLSADLDAPKLVLLKDELNGKQARLSVSQQKGSDSVQAKLVLADIKGSPNAFQSGGVTAEIDAKQGKDSLQGKFALADIKGSLKAVQSSGISGDFTAKQGARDIEGKFSSPFSANLDKLVFDLPKLAGSLGVKDPALPNGAMKGDFALQLHADVKQQLMNSGFNLHIDNTSLKGDVAVASFAKPDIKFNLNADQLDLNKLFGNKASKASTADANGSTPASAKPADLSALKDLHMDGKVNIGSILYQQYRLSNLALAVKADGQQLNVSPFAVKFDDSQIKGAFGVSRFVNPVYNFDLDIDRLDADRYITKTDASAKQAPAAKSDPNAPIDLSALKQLNANGELRIGSLKVANVKTANVRIKLKADQGVAELAPFSADLYEGSMAGSLKVDARATPSIVFKQDMKGIAIGPLLVDAINNDMLSGKGTLSVDVTTQGGTVGALKKALNGKAAVNLADGAVKGIDIAGTLRGVKDKLNVLKSQSSVEGDKSKKTDFSEMVATFNIRNGVAHNDDLSMKAPLFRITGSGDIDIANETINYLAKPTVVNSLKGQGGADLEAMNGLTIPVKLTGTFAKPSYAIDFAGLATAVAKNKLLDGVGGKKGEALKDLVGGNKEDALKSLLGGKNKTAPAATPATPPANNAAPTAPAAEPTPTPAPEKKTLTPEEKAKKKLNKILGF